MRVSKEFLKDFAFLANYYKWTPAEIEEIKQETRASSELKIYWEKLAYAHRNGYEQTKENGYMRLQNWYLERGLDDPFVLSTKEQGAA